MDSPFCNRYEIPPSFKAKFNVDIKHYADAMFSKTDGNKVS
jgi:hypothetical protein